MKRMYVQVECVERRILKVSITAASLPTPTEMLEILNNGNYDEVNDEETIECMSVDSVALIDDEEEELDEDV